MSTCAIIPPNTYSMAPYSGQWTKELASHLLRRTMLGPTQAQIDTVLAEGMALAVENILQPNIVTDEPLTWHPDEPVGPMGITWIDQFMTSDPLLEDQTNGARRRSLNSWISSRINNERSIAPNITEKMCFFWQNHFGVERTQDERLNYVYFKTIESNVIGNFKTMVEEITVNGTMMHFLDTSSNTKWNPNENYARELLELYTVGKGPQVGPGDYSHYTEEDILAGARVLTGWKVRETMSSTANPYIEFDPTQHDTDLKSLSGHLSSVDIYNDNENEYKLFIDIIFQQDATSLHISRKLYRYFVSTEITSDVENNVISVMAQTLRSNNYDIRPVLVELFKSEHFYDSTIIGSHLKSPMEFIFSMLNPTLTAPAYGYEGNNVLWELIYNASAAMDQNWLSPPSVAGWPAYYVQPGYMQLWLNSATIDRRFWFVNLITLNNSGLFSDELGTMYSLKIDAIAFVDQLQNPSDGVEVINEICELFLPRPLLQTKKDRLLNVLTNFLPAFEWTIQYSEYLANPHDQTYRAPVKDRIEAVLAELFKLPEFQSC